MMPNLDKRMKSAQEIEARELLGYLPASINHLSSLLGISRTKLTPMLFKMQESGLVHTGGGEIWYPNTGSKSIEE